MTEWRKTVSLGKRDDSEPEVVEAFASGGATVWRLSGHNIPDLLVGYLGENHAVEVKTGNAALKPGQVESFDAWRGEPVQIARTGAQAKKLLRVWEIAESVGKAPARPAPARSCCGGCSAGVCGENAPERAPEGKETKP